MIDEKKQAPLTQNPATGKNNGKTTPEDCGFRRSDWALRLPHEAT